MDDIKSKRGRLEDLTERIMRLRSSIEVTARHMELAPVKTTRRNILEEKMCKLLELEEDLVDTAIELEQLQRVADVDLAGIDAPARYREVIRLRYCEGLPWKRVAIETDYSERQCQRICYAVSEKMSHNVVFE